MTDSQLAPWFARERLAGYAPDILDRRVLLVGAGALGSALASLLAMWGFHRATVVDPDQYEWSNATRTLDFPWRRVQAGKPAFKAAEVARHWRRRVRHRVPRPEIRAVVGFSEELPPEVWAQADVVLCAVDHPRARHDVAMLAKRHRKPLISGGFDGSSGQWTVSFVGSEAAPCPSCAWEYPPVFAASDTSCTHFGQRSLEAASLPATPTLASAVAASMVDVLTECLMARLTPTSAWVRKADPRPRAHAGTERPLLQDFMLEDNPDCPHHDDDVPSPFPPQATTLGGALDALERTTPGAELVLIAPLVVNTLDSSRDLVRIAEPAWRVPSEVLAGRWPPAPTGEPVLVLDRVNLAMASAYRLRDLPAAWFHGACVREPTRSAA
jgi:molybdopterin/thiamine biosynthesis adenylyltransferase